MGKGEGFLLYFVFLVSSDCYCSVVLPDSAVCWSVEITDYTCLLLFYPGHCTNRYNIEYFNLLMNSYK